MQKHSIAVIVGSLRKESYNRKMANNLIQLSPENLNLEIVEIGDLPMYDQDCDENPPEQWLSFREKMKGHTGVIFVTPEYNRSIPGVLKNAIDVGSRPYGQSIWEGLAGAVISVSPSSMGGFGANHHLRQCMVFLNVPMMSQPEAYIGKASKLFDEDGNISDDSTKEFIVNFLKSYSQWVDINGHEQRPRFNY